jgi:hypothetical protein
MIYKKLQTLGVEETNKLKSKSPFSPDETNILLTIPSVRTSIVFQNINIYPFFRQKLQILTILMIYYKKIV